MEGALLRGFRHGPRQAMVTDCDEESVINQLLCAHAESVTAAVAPERQGAGVTATSGIGREVFAW
jgi:hypothetical protein